MPSASPHLGVNPFSSTTRVPVADPAPRQRPSWWRALGGRGRRCSLRSTSTTRAKLTAGECAKGPAAAWALAGVPLLSQTVLLPRDQ